MNLARSTILLAICMWASIRETSAGISNYVSVCDSRDANLDNCVRNRAQSLWPKMVKGIKELGIVPLEPLRMPLVQMHEGQAGSRVSINITDSMHLGWKEVTIKSANVDLKKNRFKFVLHFPQYTMIGNYQIRGRILVIPIVGTGRMNISIVGAESTLTFDGTPTLRAGKKYLSLSNVKTELQILGKTYIQMSNLFGRKELSDSMNIFLNEHANEIFKDFKPAFEEVSGQMYWAMLESFFNKVPYNKLFLGMQN